MQPVPARCDLVLPCRNEAAALPGLLARVPEEFDVIVVDNASTDGTAEVAAAHGARVVYEPSPGYGAAVHAGVLAASADEVAVLDADGSMDPRELVPMLDAVRRGDVTIAVGRRRPHGRRAWPWHARAGNALVSAWLRRRHTLPIHDIAPARVCRRDDLVALDVTDKRFGYPVELLLRARRAGWTVREYDLTYQPRAAGTTSKVSGSLLGTVRAVRDFAKVLL